MIIATGADDRFAMPMAVTLYSALANIEQDRAVSIYIIDGGISAENRQRIISALTTDSSNVHLEWVTPDLSALRGVKTTSTFSQAAYLRLLLPLVMPTEVDRVIYLDSDLVVERDLGQLWSIELDGHPAFAVRDYMYPYTSCVDWVGDTYETRCLLPRTPYCNSGVLVIDLKRWRTDEISQRAMTYMRRSEQYVRWAEQDGINAVLAGTWGLLDARWNVMLSAVGAYGLFDGLTESERRNAQRQLLLEPYIWHFTGPIKPWRFAHRGRAYSRFFDYLNKSRWFGCFDDVNELMEHTWDVNGPHDEWTKTLATSVRDLTELIPEGASLILVDESTWPGGLLEGRNTIPFLEQRGQYAGIPPDDVTAIREFERLRQGGAQFVVFASPAFWWLSHFAEFSRHLRESFRCITDNDRLKAFELQ